MEKMIMKLNVNHTLYIHGDNNKIYDANFAMASQKPYWIEDGEPDKKLYSRLFLQMGVWQNIKENIFGKLQLKAGQQYKITDGKDFAITGEYIEKLQIGWRLYLLWHLQDIEMDLFSGIEPKKEEQITKGE